MKDGIDGWMDGFNGTSLIRMEGANMPITFRASRAIAGPKWVQQHGTIHRPSEQHMEALYLLQYLFLNKSWDTHGERHQTGK